MGIRIVNLTGPVSRTAGGLFESVRRLVQELQKTGIGVSVLGTRDEFTDTDIHEWEPVPVRALKAVGPRQFGYSPDFLRLLNSLRPEILHTHGIWIYPSIAATIYARRRSIPYMISPHGMLDPWAVRNSRWKKLPAYWLYERRHLQGASCITALSESEARSFRSFGLKNPISIIPNGIDMPEKEDVGNRHAQGGVRTMLFLGRIHPKKGLLNAIRAFASLDRGRHWRLVIAGWDQGGHQGDLMKLCDDVGIKWADLENVGRGEVALPDVPVVFHGAAFGEAKKKLFETADAFILSSLSEGLPMSILEAWSYGIPVLMTDECNLPEGFASGAALRIGTDTETLKNGLEELFNMSDADRASMGSKGREMVRNQFTWSSVANRMRENYEWILGGGNRPGTLV